MPEGKWVSKENLQTFWQSIRSNLTSLVANEVNNILPPIIQEDVIDAYIPDILGNFAEVEDATTATKNYAIGNYLVLNKHFYKATAAVASGDTLVEGTNIERTNVGAEVSEIVNSALIHPRVHSKAFTASLSANVETDLTIDLTEFDLASRPFVINVSPAFSSIMQATSLLWYARSTTLTSITIGIKSNVAFSNVIFVLFFIER